MLTPETALAFFAAALLLAVAPGPDNIFVLTQSAVYGAGAGVATTFGLVTGLCVHTTAVALGVAALFQSSALAFTLLKAAGALYLLRLAWLSFRAGAALALTPEAKPPFPGYLALYRRGIVLNVTNPKVSLFFLAFLPQFCDPARGSVALQVLQLGGLFMLATVVVFCAVAPWGDGWPSGSTARRAGRCSSTGQPEPFLPGWPCCCCAAAVALERDCLTSPAPGRMGINFQRTACKTTASDSAICPRRAKNLCWMTPPSGWNPSRSSIWIAGCANPCAPRFP